MAPVAKPPAPVALSRGGHGLAIVSIALAEDGNAALTVDSGHHARLWPSLDGTREPLVLPIQPPLMTAVGRSGSDLVAAVLDTAGGLTVLRVDDADRLVSRVTVPGEPPFDDVVAIAQGFLALRSDQVVAMIDPTGKRRGELSPEPGERVVSLLHRRERTLALVASRTEVRGRWIELAAGVPRWGATTPTLAIDPATAVLSPDHVHLAAIAKKPRRAVMIDLDTGAAKPFGGGEQIPLGFVADDRVALAHVDFDFSTIGWWDLDGKRRATFGQNFELDFIAVKPTVTGDNRVAAFFDQQIALISPTGLTYLGYAVHAPSRLRASALGVVAGLGGGSTLLDATLRVDRRVPTPGDMLDSAIIDNRHAVMLVGSVDTTLDDDWLDPKLVKVKRSRFIELVDLDDRKNRQRLSLDIRETRLHYEAATRLLAVNSGTKAMFAKYDPATGRFEAPVPVRLGASIRDLALLDPALAGGDLALVAHAAPSAVAIRRIGADLTAREAVTLTGTLEAIDRAGHVYVRDTADTVVVHAADRALGRVEGLRGWKLRPSADGTRFAAFGQGRLLLANSDGTTRWAIGFPSIKDAQWAPSGELIVLAAGGLARLDAATGAVIAAQCGWKLGLRAEPTSGPRTLSICDR